MALHEILPFFFALDTAACALLPVDTRLPFMLPFVLPLYDVLPLKIAAGLCDRYIMLFFPLNVPVAGECEARFDRRVSGLEGGHGGD